MSIPSMQKQKHTSDESSFVIIETEPFQNDTLGVLPDIGSCVGKWVGIPDKDGNIELEGFGIWCNGWQRRNRRCMCRCF